MATLLALACIGNAVAGNWGAGKWNEDGRCTTDQWSECTADDNQHYVFVDADVPSQLETQISLSITYDYNTVADFTAIQNSVLLSYTDVRVKTVTSLPPGFDYWLFTTCASDATYGGGTGFYRWCRKQVIKVDVNGPAATRTLNNTADLKWLACHELGHTTGLQHPGPYDPAHPFDVNSNRQTCLTYNHSYAVLDAIDKEELIECYPRPNPVTFPLSAPCDSYNGGGV